MLLSISMKMPISDLNHYSDANIVVKGKITVGGTANANTRNY